MIVYISLDLFSKLTYSEMNIIRKLAAYAVRY